MSKPQIHVRLSPLVLKEIDKKVVEQGLEGSKGFKRGRPAWVRNLIHEELGFNEEGLPLSSWSMDNVGELVAQLRSEDIPWKNIPAKVEELSGLKLTQNACRARYLRRKKK